MEYFSNSKPVPERIAKSVPLADSPILALGAELDALVAADKAAWKKVEIQEKTIWDLLLASGQGPDRSNFATRNDYLKAVYRWGAANAGPKEQQYALKKSTEALAAWEAANAASATLRARTVDLAAMRATSLQELVFKVQFLHGDERALIASIVTDLKTMQCYWPRPELPRSDAV